jgi:hypothetical protein
MAKGVTLLAGYHDITTGISAGIMSYIQRGVAWRLMRNVWPAPFACPGMEERYVIWWIREILWNLNRVDIWQTAEGARREAAMIYRALVEQNRLP